MSDKVRAPRGSLTPEEARLRKNERQREYAKRTGDAANNASLKKNTKNISFRLFFSTDADIIEHLSGVENIAGYLKGLIRDDMQRLKELV